MTYREFLAGLAAFVLLYILLVATVIAAPKWKDEVAISSWCNDIDTMKQSVKAAVDGNLEVSNALAAKAFSTGQCVALRGRAVYFRPSEEMNKFPEFLGKTVTIVKGNLLNKDETLGPVVYVLVPDKLMGTFQLKDGLDKSTKFPKIGPQFGGGTLKVPAGWQNI